LAQPHDALFTILLDLAAQEPLELPIVVEIKLFAHSSNEFLVNGFVTTRSQAIIHMNSQKNLGHAPIVFLDILNKSDSIVVHVDTITVEQPFHKHLIPAMNSLLLAVDEALALQHPALRQPVFTR